MASPEVIVSNVTSVGPTMAEPTGAAQSSDRESRPRAVGLTNGRNVQLDPDDPRTPARAEVLDALREQQRPVYLEVDADTSTITELLIPHIAYVTSITRIDDGVLGVVLDSSHGRHLIRATTTNAAELERLAQAAVDRGSAVIVTENDRHEIIDIRDLEHDSHHPPPRYPGPGTPPQTSWWQRFVERIRTCWRCRYWPWRWRCCITMHRAQEIFDTMAATTCSPLTVPSPCIPFMYPDDGCWARAHEMCRLMIINGLSPNKVWIQGSLVAATKNNPNCHVYWGWHVAPTLCVRGKNPWRSQRMVIDPSLFTSPVTEAGWKGVQGDLNATLKDTAASDYFWGSTDPTYTDTNSKLAYYRLQLKNRSIQFGPPPYANCP